MSVWMVKVNEHLALLFFCRWLDIAISSRSSLGDAVVDDDDWDTTKAEEEEASGNEDDVNDDDVFVWAVDSDDGSVADGDVKVMCLYWSGLSCCWGSSTFGTVAGDHSRFITSCWWRCFVWFDVDCWFDKGTDMCLESREREFLWAAFFWEDEEIFFVMMRWDDEMMRWWDDNDKQRVVATSLNFKIISNKYEF